MPKYLVQASYTTEGLKGLQKDKASGRKGAVSKAIEGLGGKLEAIYFAFGADDVVVIFDLRSARQCRCRAPCHCGGCIRSHSHANHAAVDGRGSGSGSCRAGHRVPRAWR